MTEVDRENLKQWESYITGILRPSYIHAFLVDFLPQVKVEEILSLEVKSCTSSAERFFDYLIRLEQVGWYRAFLDQLGAVGYTGLLDAMENADFSEIEKLRECKNLLNRISPTIVSNIKPNEILNLMKCLLPREDEEIRKVSESKGDTAGAEKFLECLQRSDKPQFFKEFKLAVERYNYDAVSNLLSSDADDLSDCSGTKEYVMQYSEQPDDMDTYSEPIIQTPNSQQNSNDFKRMELRAYQEELAESAVDGDNTIICAPTGSGKTVVALHIVERHLMERTDQDKGKVGFLATTVPVFQQQLELFKKHFEMTNFKVYGICGDVAGSCPVEMFIERNDIIILTPQILLNCLEVGHISSLSAFTLLIFDECHNTTKNHPYNVLMRKYRDLKLGLVASAFPQIVGLTASIGVGDAGSVKDAMGYILQICANLDAENISTVKKNVEELKEHVYSAIKETKKAAVRTCNPFADIIRQIMVQVEGMAKSIYNIDNLSNIKNQNRGSQKYEQWIIEVQKKCKILQMKDMEEERRTCRALFTYTEHLRKYNDALIINDDARTKDAVKYLKSFFNNVKGGGYDETEQMLTVLFEAKEEQIRRIEADPTNENPKLTEVRKILTEEYQQNPMTKTIMFVRTRALADALKNWLKESEMLSFLQPGLLLGRAKSTGMTLPSQKEVLTSFRNDSGNKILVATSVADEGIDIAKCNLVLLYEYVGNVIKMIQTRGRGRAQNSKCILVTSKEDQIDKEMVNSAQETMMYRAIKDLQQLDRTVFVTKKNTFQAGDKIMEIKNKENTDKAAESYKLLCAKCKIYACYSDDIRKIEGAHHVVIDKSFSTRYQTQPHKNPVQIGSMQKRGKLHCKDCCHNWGITANFNPFKDLPVIKCDSFVFHHVSSGSPQIVKKWKDVPFSIKTFDSAEFYQETI